MTPSIANIERAAAAIDPVFLHTPQLAFDRLNRLLGLSLVSKVETLNPIRSFKGRGAGFYVHNLEDLGPLVTASAGNFGQGLAYAARRRGVPLTVFAATGANRVKIERMRELGAEVVLAGRDFDAAKDAARDYAARTASRFVEDGREMPVTEGAGTIAVELLGWPEPLHAVVVPVGNGALINGIGAWVRAKSPATRIIGVCAAGAPAMERSWRARSFAATAAVDTIADGIAVRVPVPEALELMRVTVDEMVIVEDAAILRAMRLLLDETGLLVEPAGAAGLAAIMVDLPAFAGRTVATVLCGGNVTPEQFDCWFAARRGADPGSAATAK